MHKELLIKAFEKAKEETGYSVTKRLATHISDFILEESGQAFGERSLRDYYNTARKENTTIELKPFVVEALCSFLDYKSYQNFLNDQNPKIKNQDKGRTEMRWTTKSKAYSSIVVGVIITLLGYYFLRDKDSTNYMLWQEDRYIEVSLDTISGSLEKVVPLDRQTMENLKKVNLDCESTFFNENGDPVIWYGKNSSGELEFFTAIGRHPETGKTLKEITDYMIKKYICPSS